MNHLEILIRIIIFVIVIIGIVAFFIHCYKDGEKNGYLGWGNRGD